MLKFVLQIVDGLLQIVNLGVFVTCSADVLDCIAEVEVKTLVTDEVPDLDLASTIVFRSVIAAAH